MNVDQVPLALSCGDPAGIGPESALRAALHWAEAYPSLLFGDPEQLQGIARRLGKAPLPVLATAQEWTAPDEHAVAHAAEQRQKREARRPRSAWLPLLVALVVLFVLFLFHIAV